MSTRSVIGRTTDHGRTFTGVYHHWDGYPQCLGATLWELYREHFGRDLPTMLAVLIDQHPAGWSTINDADWSLPSGPRPDHNLIKCVECDLPNWMHYGQSYHGPNNASAEAAFAHLEIDRHGGDGAYMVLGHSPTVGEEPPHGPTCFPDREANVMNQTNASGAGCEWAYAFDEASGIMFVLSSYCGDGGQKMIGAFGMGDEKATWREVARIDLADDTEPDWESIANRTPVAVC